MAKQIYQLAGVIETEAVLSKKTASLDGLVKLFGDAVRLRAKVHKTTAEQLALDIFRDTSDRDVRRAAIVWLDRQGCGYVEVE